MTKNPTYRYSGIDWKLRSEQELSAGTLVEVTGVSVGKFIVKAKVWWAFILYFTTINIASPLALAFASYYWALGYATDNLAKNFFQPNLLNWARKEVGKTILPQVL